LLRHIDVFTAVSTAAAEYLLSLAEVPVTIIPNGINLKHFQHSVAHAGGAKKKQPKTILYIGRLENRKGVKHLLDAFALLQERVPKARLVIAGDGPDREKLEMQAEELNLRNVEFLGFVDETTKKQLLHTADLFCSPALYGESFGIVLLEAMASGLVTVAGDNPGYEAVMQGLGQLSLINPKDSALFAHRLQLLLLDEDLRSLWKKWAKTYVQQFDYSKIVDKYEAVYMQALKNVKKA
jgi:phosphatidylinositol alpha-mannosyltransferase